jgi:hypothetical protein
MVESEFIARVSCANLCSRALFGNIKANKLVRLKDADTFSPIGVEQGGKHSYILEPTAVPKFSFVL